MEKLRSLASDDVHRVRDELSEAVCGRAITADWERVSPGTAVTCRVCRAKVVVGDEERLGAARGGPAAE